MATAHAALNCKPVSLFTDFVCNLSLKTHKSCIPDSYQKEIGLSLRKRELDVYIYYHAQPRQIYVADPVRDNPGVPTPFQYITPCLPCVTKIAGTRNAIDPRDSQTQVNFDQTQHLPDFQ